MLTDTIVALATAPGPSALAIVRLSGPEAISITAQVFRGRRALSDLPSHSCAVGRLVAGQETVDHVVVSLFRAPRSYTGEDLIEISCHGGHTVPGQVVKLLRGAGARPAGAGEFTLRAFTHGKMDLAQAEAVAALIQARSTAGARAAARVLAGGLRRPLEASLTALTRAVADTEASLDVQEDGEASVADEAGGDPGIGPALAASVRAERERLTKLLAGGRTGALLEEGLRLVLVGKPNAGKSSIFNALLARERAIVSPEPGTTRDMLEAWVDWAGLPIAIQDTAGLRPAASGIEAAGIQVTRAALEAATLALLVIDSDATEPEEIGQEIQALGVSPEKVVVTLHKWDLGPVPGWRKLARRRKVRLGSQDIPVVASSTVAAPGVTALYDLLQERLATGVGDPGATLLVGERQRDLLASALDALNAADQLEAEGAGRELVAIELRRALARIGEILGRDVGPLVLEEIFSRFCVGK